MSLNYLLSVQQIAVFQELFDDQRAFQTIWETLIKIFRISPFLDIKRNGWTNIISLFGNKCLHSSS